MLGDDEPETAGNDEEWSEPDNTTIVELEKRVDTVKTVCRLRALPTKPINSKEFFVDHAHSLVWCNIFKAASSYWLYKFNILGKLLLLTLLSWNCIASYVTFYRSCSFPFQEDMTKSSYRRREKCHLC